ncbi:DoxX family protein [Parapedobacter sp. ISTM3]|uniref:DoxX-like family protein n=1 Tax=Parapedobacter luteus TaxID=623280 RepID=A0A1T5ANQ3_9SPHI|nr:MULTISPECIES: DoxX family protein [Parapedobacter]MBK1441921.1 DoxX family protein [Parapedobacter sp. ISTM3]SKB36671.1 DoxX-like family protein [Parapedobacter luteus]
MKQKLIYWLATGLISLMMLYSGYAYFTDPNINQGFVHLGFPSYFRIQLGVAKIIGVLLLLLPFVPIWLKEWTYVGFGITFISAFIAHVASGDPVSMVMGPLIALVILLVSYAYLRKQTFAKAFTVRGHA